MRDPENTHIENTHPRDNALGRHYSVCLLVWGLNLLCLFFLLPLGYDLLAIALRPLLNIAIRLITIDLSFPRCTAEPRP